ncbi:hypothetical protein [Halobellus rufus]|nr:hypothetical protein [Halobellus rufus]
MLVGGVFDDVTALRIARPVGTPGGGLLLEPPEAKYVASSGMSSS